MESGEGVLLGLDRVKDREVLLRAYNDGQGVTAEFNRNILRVANQLAGTNFQPRDFDHRALYNLKEHRIEMYLRARRDVQVKSPCLEGSIRIRKGESIHTENSHKFTSTHLQILAEAAGMKIRCIWTDQRNWFYLMYMEKE